ncbi:MAG: YqeG family HAD IIIA-type phosphatase [Oscillospiraceae bacterium]|nr:YqeG family HAD IIIA-type phosphatase [Oscillospiraceae bacterium]
MKFFPFRLPVPDVMRDSIYDLTPRMFTLRGIRLLLLDIDNTIAPYTVNEAGSRLRSWVRDMQRAGLELYILSNNKGSRPEIFSAALGLPYRKHARKPFVKTALEVLAETGHTPAETAFIGDQIYTDTLCAKCCGAWAVTVKPIAFTNPWLRLRYWAEAPFRLAGQRRQTHSTSIRKEANQ